VLSPVAFRGGLVDPRKPEPKKDTRPGDKDKPVQIFARGNQILIATDDQEALALIQQLINIYIRNPGPGDYEIIKLGSANAIDAAQALDEVFNGKPAPLAGGRGGGGGPGGGRGGGGPGAFFAQFGAPQAAPPPAPTENRIRVVAYPPTNSLLVRATPLDMISIRNLLAKALDTDDNNSTGNLNRYRITLKYASAANIANVIKDVYSQQTGGITPTATPGGGFGFFGALAAAQSQGQQANGKRINLTVGVDEPTNSLIMSCSELLYKDIDKLVKELDRDTSTATRTVRVVPIIGIDPFVVQQAIDALQGRTTIRPATPGLPGGPPGGGMPAGGPGNRGGGNGGGPGNRGGGGMGGFRPGGMGDSRPVGGRDFRI
jgi:type II secretory pathway component GspD/PulD (secretin)